MAEQKVAVITGGTRGIGRAISMALAESGVHVCAGYQSNREAAESMCEAAEKMGQSVSIHQMEVGEPEDCVRFVNDATEEHGHVDYLINNAGINIDRTVRRMTIDEWHGVIEHMISRGSGRIVNISSIIGETGNVGQANYATAKSGMHGLTKTLALELAGKGITVNCVAPGFINTDMMASVPEAVLEKIVAQIPIGRLGKPEEVAYVVTSLLDDRASYVTGAVISVNGGLDM
jgi:NAD(P)-dependent dehydrogenase (short-subunit alcohol dehydrogenase family)